MSKVTEAVARIRGRRGTKDYDRLCWVLEAALDHMPEERNITCLCEEVGQIHGQKPSTVYKAAARAVQDSWMHGDRRELERIANCRFWEEPSPKEVVSSLAQGLWSEEEQPGEYHIMEGGLLGKYGLWVRGTSPDCRSIILAPFTEDREAVQRLVDRLNQEKLLVSQFQKMLMEGALLEI